jgi:hypothetical protein
MHRFVLVLMVALGAVAADVPSALRQWWSYTEALSNDSMQGRDTGSEGYRRAAAYVISQFQAADLKAAGSNGFYQPVPLHEVRLITNDSSARVVRADATESLAWLRDLTVSPAVNMPANVAGTLLFAGSDMHYSDMTGKIVVRLRGNIRESSAPQAQFSGATALIVIDTTAGPEPPRWPAAYSTAMRLLDDPLPRAPRQITFRFNPASADKIFARSGHTYQELRLLAEASKPLPTFNIPARFEADMHVAARELTSDNIIAAFPGSDPELSKQYIVVSAHLDGYGFGEPWKGDNLYNGTFDDAAYVATLMDLAQKLHDTHSHTKRSILFCVFTGEEKGLLGSKYFTTHLTVSRQQLAADINLDQLRPIFSLKILTALALTDSTLGETAAKVATAMGIRLQPDPEPERNLLRRSDHYSFMQIGVPAMGFIFGYEKGSPDEATYRRWYAERYHSPADDLNQPWNPAAAAKFNEFFDRLVIELADQDARPAWLPGSPFASSSAS